MDGLTLTLSKPEFEHIRVTLEGAKEELEDLSAQISWFATAIPERIETCLEIIERAQ